ncbi:MAG TPA: efflux RND transporter periplasmic adaptor subunit [bacterium]|nr:efflux RND transporter periplasmic adaptor subunit [bacterium]HQG46365.1 efflux RND transporter periplasmic adaptor subunit [bacterium]HQJ63134.1 efflux RND transporter periplasmic adaptor subunit [bacterium]
MLKRNRKKWYWLIAAVVIVILLAASIMAKAKKGEEKGPAKVKVGRMDIIDKALAVGAIEPRNEIAVKSKTSGVVGKLYVEVGDHIQAGAPLLDVRPDPTPLELAEATRGVEIAEIELATLSKELERQKELQAKGLIAQQEYETLAQQHDQASVRTQIARERLALLKKGRINIAGNAIETTVRAPITGYILQKSVNLGDPVVPLTSYQAGTELMKMADMKDLLFRGTLDEIDVGKITEGMPCELQIGALPGKTVKGHVSLISLKARKEENTTLFPVEIAIDDAAGAVLRAGFSANASVIISKKEKVLAIPERVVTFRNDSAFVQISTGPESSKEQYIRTGLSDAINIEVISGLQEGQEVLEKKVKPIV